LDLRGFKWQEAARNFTRRNFKTCAPYQITFIKSRMMRWVEYVAHIYRRKVVKKLFLEEQDG
jgi:hypothetical protein